ncbi:hypothetical protein B0H13DRAFT_2313178 [Mycena leptocephala]|nr:hypothetical protein B0H13DRAFT_2313178 [Mycena leptocephala]
MTSSTFSLVAFLLLGGFQLVNAQTTITAFAPVAPSDPVPPPAGVQITGQFAPIGVLSNGNVVFTEHVVATVPGAGVGNFDGIAVEGSNDFELTAVLTAQVDGQTVVVNIGESCSFAAASASGAQPTGNCAIIKDFTLLGQGQAVHTATTIVATQSDVTTFTVPTALPTLGDSSLKLKGRADGIDRASFLFLPILLPALISPSSSPSSPDGARCSLALARDIKEFQQTIADIALAADVGSLPYVLKIVGNHSLLHELAFSAADAQRMGLFSCVVPGGRAEVWKATRYRGEEPLGGWGDEAHFSAFAGS